ncbi:hypothetical protein [Bacillus altitudinis]|uniref:hypothetical protein n=2 Tax=Bacillus altitudinis TaxID=293387 RepID=UPI00148EA1E2|nr:hypothetical protein [Bacillus altitudinis]NOL32730.1 hypothetical protein [Bacillus altitudinis]
MKLLKVSKTAADTYRKTVKGRSKFSDQKIQKKLNRHITCLKKREPDRIIKQGLLSKVYLYGNLMIKVRWGKIVEVINLPHKLRIEKRLEDSVFQAIENQLKNK